MSTIFGNIQVDNLETAFLANVGQALVLEELSKHLALHNEEIERVYGAFVARNTEKFKMRWLAPGSGTMQPGSELAPAPAAQRYGSWDVAFPLRIWQETLAMSRRGAAYTSLAELKAQFDTITIKNRNTHRERILTALFEDTALTYTDPVGHGTLTIQRLANNDTVTYPVLPGATAEAVDQHYHESDYTVANIDANDNPVVTLRDEVIQHFGGRSSFGENILFLSHSDITPKLEAISGFYPSADFGVAYGEDTDLAKFIRDMPGRIYGRGWGCWLSEWEEIPETYCIAVHLDFPPLLRRVDPGYTGLGSGLQLVAVNQDYPLTGSYYEDVFGYGVANRLSAAVLEVSGGDGSYAPPSAYSE